MRTVFEPVKVRGKKSGKCLCGKRLSKSKTFEQTLNPFNKNALGLPKSAEEILEELRAELFAWRDRPVYHELAEPSYWRWPKEVQEQYENGSIVMVKMICGQNRPKRKGEE